MSHPRLRHKWTERRYSLTSSSSNRSRTQGRAHVVNKMNSDYNLRSYQGIRSTQWTRHCSKHSTRIAPLILKNTYSLHFRDEGAKTWRLKPLSWDHAAKIGVVGGDQDSIACRLSDWEPPWAVRVTEFRAMCWLWDSHLAEQRQQGARRDWKQMLLTKCWVGKKLTFRGLHAAGVLPVKFQSTKPQHYVVYAYRFMW